MLEEKCIAMIKSLPKQIRKHFVPVPETVKRCLEIEPDFKGTVQEWLGNRLRKLTSEAIPLNAWSMDSLPEHLKMNFRIVEDGKLLDYGRDLKKLQAKYAVEAGDSFDQIAADELNYTGCIQWAFEDLPETYAFIQKGQDFIGFPALVDEGDAVGVKIFDTQIKAALQHSAGLMRLFALQLRKECSYVSKNLAPSAAVELSYQRLPKHPIVATSQTTNTYKDDMLTLILHSVFIDGKTIRTQAAFEQSLRDNKGQLMTVANEASKITLDIMTLYTVIKTALQRLNANDPLAKDLNEQLDLLIYAGFIRHTPYTQIKAIPRYLKAAHYRLDKYDNNAQKVQEVNRYAVRYWKDVEKKTKKDTVIPEHDAFRWALEEFRVSLFAQQLKTAYPVSAKRMDKLWDEY
jgi:ATP-dependent helicase HrpA